MINANCFGMLKYYPSLDQSVIRVIQKKNLEKKIKMSIIFQKAHIPIPNELNLFEKLFHGRLLDSVASTKRGERRRTNFRWSEPELNPGTYAQKSGTLTTEPQL